MMTWSLKKTTASERHTHKLPKILITAILLLIMAISSTYAYGVDIDAEKPYTILETYYSQMPEDLSVTLKYDRYPAPEHYVVMLNGTTNIRSKPGLDGKIIKKAQLNEKLAVIQKVEGRKWSSTSSPYWYRVYWKDINGMNRFGFITADLATKREFQFDKMFAELLHLEKNVNGKRTGYIDNFRNVNGAPPLFQGQYAQDNYGIERYQAAPGYKEPSTSSTFRYIQDGRLVDILGESGNFYKVNVIDLRETFYIPKKYITERNSIQELKQTIVIDRKNQNEGVFEKIDGKWHMISYVYATTGAQDKYRYPTDLGDFMAIYTRDKFLYLDDETKELAGYAPYAIRFNGGAFIHGVPVNYTLVKQRVVISPAVYDAAGNVVTPAVTAVRIVDYKDPGMIEFSSGLGTVPRSHKCVRNYTSHAKFLYDWISIGEASVIVIE